MKKLMVLSFVPMIFLFSVCAQEPDTDGRALLEQAVQSVKLGEEPDCEPMDTLNVNEFIPKRRELDGKVVKLIFDSVLSLRQVVGQGDRYLAAVSFQESGAGERLRIVVPKHGFDFFQGLNDPDICREEVIYVYVSGPLAVVALGTRYRADEPVGERYRW